MRRLVVVVAVLAGSLVWVPPAGAVPLVMPSTVAAGPQSLTIVCPPGSVINLIGLCDAPTPPECKTPPAPSVPGTGTPGIFDPSPDGGSTSLYDRYQYGPKRWAPYDVGCGPGLAQNPAAMIDTFFGNVGYGVAVDLVAFGNGVHRLVSPPRFLSAFDRLETSTTQALYERLFLVFLPVSLLLLGLILVLRSRHQDLPGAVRAVTWALFVVFVATLAYSGPVRLGRAADSIEVGAVAAIDQALAGPNGGTANASASIEVDSVLRPAWLQGELGSQSGATVERFGQPLWDAQALTWDEARGSDPSKAAGVKQAKFAKLAKEVHDADPAAYESLKGTNVPNRSEAAVVAVAGAVLTVPFRVLTDLFLLASLILIRVIVMFLPLLAIAGLHDRMSGLVRGTLIAGAAAVINAVAFAAAGAINTFGVGQILAPSTGLPLWLALICCGLLSMVLWFASKPFRHLTRMVSGYSPVHGVVDGVTGSLRRGADVVVDAGTGYVSAGWAATRALSRRDGEDDEEGEDRPVREDVGEADEPDSVTVERPEDDGMDWSDPDPSEPDWELEWPWTDEGADAVPDDDDDAADEVEEVSA